MVQKLNDELERTMLEPVIKTIDVPCSQEMAFQVFVNDMPSWWPLDKNSVSAMQGEVARSVSIDPKSGGQVVETAHDGSEHHWATITTYDPYNEFVLDWHIGISSDKATKVSVRFNKLSDQQTQVVLTHSGWEAFAEKASDMRNGYNQGWVGVFEQAYKSACTA